MKSKADIQALMDLLKADILREDGRLERSCRHGCGHPVGHIEKWEPWMAIHGCDGCCAQWTKEAAKEAQDELPTNH